MGLFGFIDWLASDIPVLATSERVDPREAISRRREHQMRKLSLLVILLSLAGMLPSSESFGQSALRGAVIGGAIGGRRGAAIGATAGAVAGAHRRHHHWHRYYWRNGSCWHRTQSGRSHRVSHRYCR